MIQFSKMIWSSLTKGRFLIIFLVLLVLSSILYLCINSLRENDSVQSSYRCMSELKSVKYQLNVVTEYKNRIDKLLTDTQKTHNADKERFKDVMESCSAMKQQISICQSQFEDLQSECKMVKQDYDKIKKDVEKLK